MLLNCGVGEDSCESLNCMKIKPFNCKGKVKRWKLSHSVMSDWATLWTVAHQAPPSIGFSRQEYWSGLPYPSPGDLPDPGIKPRSPALEADALTSEPPGKPNCKGNQSWIFIGRTDAEAQGPILWHLIQSTDSLEKTLILGKTEGRRRRGWQRMRWLDGDGHGFGQALGVGDGQGSLACCSPWGHKQPDRTEQQTWRHLTQWNNKS